MKKVVKSRIPDIDCLLALVRKIVGQVGAQNGVPLIDQSDLLGDVLVKIVKDDYAVLRAFRGGQLGMFLKTVIYRMLLDRRTAAWGKWQASRKARELGDAAIRMERLLVRDRLTAPEAVQVLAHDPKWCVTSDTARNILAALPAKRRPIEVPLDSDVDAASPEHDPLIAAGLESAADRVRSTLHAALRSLAAGDRDLLLRRFRHGVPVSCIARELGLDQKSLYRRYQRIFTGLRRELECAGVTIDEIRPLFGAGLLSSLSSQDSTCASLVTAAHAAANARLSTLSHPV